MPDILLIRHGTRDSTNDFPDERQPLSPKGKQEVEKLVEGLKGVNLAPSYSVIHVEKPNQTFTFSREDALVFAGVGALVSVMLFGILATAKWSPPQATGVRERPEPRVREASDATRSTTDMSTRPPT